MSEESQMMNEEQNPGSTYNRVMSKESEAMNEEQDPGSTLSRSALPHRLSL